MSIRAQSIEDPSIVSHVTSAGINLTGVCVCVCVCVRVCVCVCVFVCVFVYRQQFNSHQISQMVTSCLMQFYNVTSIVECVCDVCRCTCVGISLVVYSLIDYFSM